jgi:hypothetical protein
VVASKSLILFDPKVLLLANYLLTEGTHELVPTFDSELGVRYLEGERVTDDDPETVSRWLAELATKGVLEKRFVSKLVICPKCGSTDTPVHYCCPHCRSIEIDKKALFEHLACGVIDKEDNFKKGEQLICPRCSRELGELGITHRSVGTWFLCRTCQKAFDRPQSFHVCGRCRQLFVIEDAKMSDVYAYKLSKGAEDELRSGGLFLKPIKDLMEQLGFRVKVAGVLQGASGAEHRFDLLGTRDKGKAKETVALDVVTSSGYVGDATVIATFAKRYDTNPTRLVLVVVPRMEESGKKLAGLYGIEVIEARSASEAEDKLSVVLALP